MMLWKISIGVVLFFIAGLFLDMEPFKTLTYASALGILIYDVIIALIRSAASKNRSGMELVNGGLLSVISALGLLAIGKASGAVGVMLFFQIIKLLFEITEEKIAKTTEPLTKLMSNHANLKQDDEFASVPPENVKIGDIIVVRSGERVPLDGIVETGEGFMDTRVFTSEGAPREIHPGSEILSGSINTGSPLYIRVTRLCGDGTAAQITKLISNAPLSRSVSEIKLQKFVGIYTAAAVIAACASALILPIFANDSGIMHSLYYSFIFLAVISPRCISKTAPAVFAAAVGRLAKNGILIRGAEYIEAIAKAKNVLFGKASLVNESEYPDSIVAVSGFAARSIKTTLITEDNKDAAQKLADHLGIDEIHSELNEKSKANTLSLEAQKGSCIYVGGADEATLYRTADVGIALGEQHTADALASAGAVLMTNEPSKLLKLYDTSKKAYRIFKFNILIAFAAKLAVLAFAVFADIEIWPAVMLDSLISIFTMGNTLRILKK